jgi:hypothetical protein
MTVRIKTIYLDMDGVLTDFESRWHELYNESPMDTRARKNMSENWDNFVLTGQFATLPTFPGWEDLLAAVRATDAQIEILSSSGGQKFHEQVTEQKKTWLKNHGLDVPVNIVPGRRIKANYADASKLLIDDTSDVIMSFHEAGGYAIQHDSAPRTIKMLKGFFNDDGLY